MSVRVPNIVLICLSVSLYESKQKYIFPASDTSGNVPAHLLSIDSTGEDIKIKP